ncbi:MAG TPA: helix-turn-helix domain-containing protein [Candidatus Paceibacterota bacterium]|jgi:hypothetical protein|nr:helix-turn-helix domain-containing protein [Candidatus Paceibacterota bacterium]
MKLALREKAIQLRIAGHSYREIMAEVPVAKSTISLWLRSVGLSKQQKRRLTEKRLTAIRLGAKTKHDKRIAVTKEIMKGAMQEVGEITDRELWLIGTALYWAEGSKEKDYAPGCGVQFSNTDPAMIRLFIYWLKKVFNKDLEDLIIDIYIHDLYRSRTLEIKRFWCAALKCEPENITHVYYKKGNPKTLRKNIGVSYHGTIRLKVRASSLLNRRIVGWTQGMIECLR